MEAKDTVMSPEMAGKIANVPIGSKLFDKEIEDYWWSITNKLLTRQAGISFEAGKQEGYRLGYEAGRHEQIRSKHLCLSCRGILDGTVKVD